MPRRAAQAHEAEITCTLDTLLAERQMTLAKLADAVGISVVNLSVLKNNRGQAVRFSTLAAICDALECDVGDLLTRRRPPPLRDGSAAGAGDDGRAVAVDVTGPGPP